MDAEGLNKCMLMKDVRVEDEFDVELADVNVHTGQILVKALRRRAGCVYDGEPTTYLFCVASYDDFGIVGPAAWPQSPGQERKGPCFGRARTVVA
ncbi:hypothetical protein NQ176_g6438 [Zarea fungicola]|uniref:Uncharacterized protein n=1 Tax=Zarea fungicola TaxID=93591 RepID=A0ACC1N426_9HYPO|nr:hypothetical protein NQ176_g6438 [Lecanicillium fungicola]